MGLDCIHSVGLSENYSFLISLFIKKDEVDNAKVYFLLELVVILNES